jgi:hypothetical protein
LFRLPLESVNFNVDVPFISGLEDAVPARLIETGNLEWVPVGTSDCCKMVIINAVELVGNVTIPEVQHATNIGRVSL